MASTNLSEPCVFILKKWKKKKHIRSSKTLAWEDKVFANQNIVSRLLFGDNRMTSGTGRAADQHLLSHPLGSAAEPPCRASWDDGNVQDLHGPLWHVWLVSSSTVTSVTKKQSF